MRRWGEWRAGHEAGPWAKLNVGGWSPPASRRPSGPQLQAGRSACGASPPSSSGPQKIRHITSLNSDPSGNLILGTAAEGGILIGAIRLPIVSIVSPPPRRQWSAVGVRPWSRPMVGTPSQPPRGCSIWVYSSMCLLHMSHRADHELDHADKAIQTNTTEELLEVRHDPGLGPTIYRRHHRGGR